MTAIAVLVAVTGAGCGDSSADDPTPAAPTKAATTALASAYVTRLNELCTELEPKVMAIYHSGGHPGPFPIAVFEAEQPPLTKLTKASDARAAAIPHTDADQQAVDAFEAFRRASDQATAIMATAAATGRQARFDAAFYEVHKMFDTTSTLNDLQAAGIVCNAR